MAPERSPQNVTTTTTAFKNLMAQQQAYEILIAEKLDTLPVPDLADAIWARIETQLDIDLPTDDGGNDPDPQAPSGPSVLTWGLSVMIVALLAAFLLYKNKPEPIQPTTQSSPTITERIQQPAPQTTGPPSSTKTIRRPDPTTTPKNNPAVAITPPFDSVVQQPVAIAPLQLPDTLQKRASEPLVITPPRDTTTPQKKKRGVSGINEGDYRIVPTKGDSL